MIKIIKIKWIYIHIYKSEIETRNQLILEPTTISIIHEYY